MMSSYKKLLIFQIVLFCLIIILPWYGLLLGFVHIPTGEEGRWFDKIWDIMLTVSSFSILATVFKAVDEHYTNTTKGMGNEKTDSVTNINNIASN